MKTYAYTKSYKQILITLICNSQKLKITHISINSWVGKEIVITCIMWTYQHRKEWTSDIRSNMVEFHNKYVEWKKSDKKVSFVWVINDGDGVSYADI